MHPISLQPTSTLVWRSRFESDHVPQTDLPRPVSKWPVGLGLWLGGLTLLAIAGMDACRPALGEAMSSEMPDSTTERAPADAIRHGFQPTSRVRGPMAAAWSREADRLLVAHRQSGSVSVIDANTLELISEQDLGRQLSAVVAIPESDLVIFADSARDQILITTFHEHQFEILQRIPTPRTPVHLALSGDGRRLATTCLWSRRVLVWDVADLLNTASAPNTAAVPQQGDSHADVSDMTNGQEIELPFPPRLILAIGEHDFLVGDAFGGNLAWIDGVTVQLGGIGEIKGHNISGVAVALDGQSISLTHQFLNPLASTTRDDILWGILIENLIQTIPLDGLPGSSSSTPSSLSEEPRSIRGEVVRLGEVGRGAADPAGLTWFRDAQGQPRRVVALAGVNQVLIESGSSGNPVRREVGLRPTQVLIHPHQRRAYVLNSLSDSVSVIELDALEHVETVSLGPSPPPGPALRGERLFYDASLSLHGWLSCHSCHTEGHTSGLLADTAADGSFGTPKVILSLLGTRDANPWGWNGSFRELHQQVRQSVVSSMQGSPLTAAEERDLVTYLHTLTPPPPLMPPRSEADAEQVARGENLFRAQGCTTCHVPPVTYTSDAVYDVGLTDEAGLTKFNPPTLRGVSQRRGFFHDQRAGSLREVLVDHAHMNEGLTDADREDLLRFLLSL